MADANAAPVIDEHARQAQLLARLANEMAAALTRFARDLSTPPASDEDRAQLGPRKAGRRQQRILELLALAPDGGIPSAAVAAALGIRAQNAHNALQRLVELGAVEKVPDEEPAHWRLSAAT